MTRDKSKCPTETHAPTTVAEEQREETCDGTSFNLLKTQGLYIIELFIISIIELQRLCRLISYYCSNSDHVIQ